MVSLTREGGLGRWYGEAAKLLPGLFLAVLATILWMSFPKYFIADDAYFYLVIARNYAETDLFSFSGLYETNGFHPLWGWLLAGYADTIDYLGFSLRFLEAFIVVPALVHILGSIFFVRALCKARLNMLGALVPIAFLSFFGVLFSEAHLIFLVLAIFITVFLTFPSAEVRTYVLLGFIGGILCLSRLDSVFFVGAFAICVTLNFGFKKGLSYAATVGVVLLPYLIYNFFVYGGITPVSGWIKSSLPTIQSPSLTISGLNSTFGGYYLIFGWLPAVIGVGTLLFYCRKGKVKNKQLFQLVLALTIGIVIQGTYYSLFATYPALWHWYYVLGIVLVGLCASGLLSNLGYDWFTDWQRPLVWTVVVSVGAVLIYDKVLYPDDYFEGRPGLILDVFEEMNIDKRVVFISDVPGVAAFYSNNKIIADDMLTANRKYVTKMLESDNAFNFIERNLKARDEHIEYFIMVGGGVEMNADGSLIYYHPKYPESEEIVGVRKFGVTPRLFLRGDERAYVWDCSEGC